ncbi:MAG: DUF2660 domain-containing protein [Rickettsiaceae bacterium]|nr:DUF2660 domain-containing protein [Rickettsiaceae bacterium]
MPISSDPQIFIILGALIVCFFAFKYIKKNKKEKLKPYITKDNPDAQKIYDKKNRDPNYLNKEEKIELSWLFLYDITDKVLNSFSKEDREAVEAIGKQMLENGAGYEHVVEYGIKKPKKQSRLNAANEKDAQATNQQAIGK